jgi:hypothetical protein
MKGRCQNAVVERWCGYEEVETWFAIVSQEKDRPHHGGSNDGNLKMVRATTHFHDTKKNILSQATSAVVP